MQFTLPYLLTMQGGLGTGLPVKACCEPFIVSVAGGFGVQLGTRQWASGGKGGAWGVVPPLSPVLCLRRVGPAGWRGPS